MEVRQLGASGVRVSKLCLGTMNFGGGTDEAEARRIVDEALAAGINFVDTADVYARGVSEEFTGKALVANGHRDDVVLATKGVATMGDGTNDRGASRYHLTRAVENSLRRLQTDRIDLYYLHITDIDTPVAEILDTLDVLVKQGKILCVGTSKWPVPLIMEGLALSERYRLPRP
jgi:aryl-alcohol dehydrogenase-like predicted oxidoreductase